MTGASSSNFKAVLEDFVSSGHSPVVIGGMAVVLYGSPRLTADLDVAYPDLKAAVEIVYARGFQLVIRSYRDDATGTTELETASDAEQALILLMKRDPPAFRTIHPDSLEELDIWMRPDISYKELIKDSSTMVVQGVRLPVASPKHLIQLKRNAIKDGSAKSSIHQMDIEYLEGLISRTKNRQKKER